jgi:SAM-dependent methyltransferase
MNTPPAETIKQEVRQRYGRIARDNGSCCGPSTAASCCGAPDAAAEIVFSDYTALSAQVVSEADLGLGCGTPTLTAGLHPGQTVLDLGSGAGIDVFLAAQAVGAQGRVIGVDMTPEMIARARANAAKGGFTNVEFRLGEIEQLPVEANTVDVVLSNCVINLVPDKNRAFAEVYRVLKPGGRFSISDMVSYGAVPAAMRQDMMLWAGCIAGALDREDYLGIIRAAGFQNVRVERETTYGAEAAGLNGDFGLASVTVVAEK